MQNGGYPMNLKERIGHFFDATLGWHVPVKGIEGFDGASFHATCKYCGKEIMQDSQGNWF
jgi:hypothetical protein